MDFLLKNNIINKLMWIILFLLNINNNYVYCKIYNNRRYKDVRKNFITDEKEKKKKFNFNKINNYDKQPQYNHACKNFITDEKEKKKKIIQKIKKNNTFNLWTKVIFTIILTSIILIILVKSIKYFRNRKLMSSFIEDAMIKKKEQKELKKKGKEYKLQNIQQAPIDKLTLSFQLKDFHNQKINNKNYYDQFATELKTNFENITYNDTDNSYNFKMELITKEFFSKYDNLIDLIKYLNKMIQEAKDEYEKDISKLKKNLSQKDSEILDYKYHINYFFHYKKKMIEYLNLQTDFDYIENIKYNKNEIFYINNPRYNNYFFTIDQGYSNSGNRINLFKKENDKYINLIAYELFYDKIDKIYYNNMSILLGHYIFIIDNNNNNVSLDFCIKENEIVCRSSHIDIILPTQDKFLNIINELQNILNG